MTRPAPVAFTRHLGQPWRVHEIAPDFELLDVWRFPLRGRADQFPAFARLMRDMPGVVARTNWLTRALFRLRLALGQRFGWDRERPPLPIPGCAEHSIAARLPGGHDACAPRSEAEFHPVYESERESLAEISNATIHALMHLGWVDEGDGYTPHMAVYVKHRGLGSRLYMALIRPFRHYIVYPSLLRAVAKRWHELEQTARLVAPAAERNDPRRRSAIKTTAEPHSPSADPSV